MNQRENDIRELYWVFFRRTPDEEGLRVNMESHATIPQLAERFMNSNEYKAKRAFWRDGYEFTQITSHLCVGARIDRGAEEEIIRHHGINAVVSLDRGADYDVWRFSYAASIPFPDGELMSIRQAVCAVRTVGNFIATGNKTLVHCH